MRDDVMEERLKDILKKYVGCSKVEQLWQNGQDLLLTGDKWDISAITMTYIFLEIEKTFQIRIDASSILNYEFGTIKGIKVIIHKYTDEKRCNLAEL